MMTPGQAKIVAKAMEHFNKVVPPRPSWPELGSQVTNDYDEVCLVVGHELDNGKAWVTVKLPTGSKAFYPLETFWSVYHAR